MTIDLIFGLPFQSLESWGQSLAKALSYGFGHMSVYELTLEDKTPFAKQYRQSVKPLPRESQSVAMFHLAHDILTDPRHGFEHYEISSYSKPGCHSRHNTMYWTADTNYLAFGCGATSYIDGVRFERPRTLKKYQRWVEQLTPQNHFYNCSESRESER